MRTSYYFLPALLSALLLTGCSSFGTKTFKEFNINEGTSVSVDITQRAILVKGNRVCAEPSPEGMVAATVQAAVSGEAETAATLAGNLAASQSASSVGVRTATIQLLRDGYYRACEATMNGVVDGEGYAQILSGITPLMVGLVAIDGLTQMPAPIVQVSASGTSATTEAGTSATANAANSGANAAKAEVTAVADQVVRIVEMMLDNHLERTKFMFE